MQRTNRTTTNPSATNPSGPRRERIHLLANAKLTDDIDVPLSVDATQIVEQAAAAADHGEQTAATGIILLVRPHVLGQVVDPRRENRNLHLRRARVGLLAPVLRDQFPLPLFGDCHSRFRSLVGNPASALWRL